MDSCDASGEYTTGESDLDRQSISSEDMQSSVATYRRFFAGMGSSTAHSLSQEIFGDTDKTPVKEPVQQAAFDTSSPKVVLRPKRKSDGPRPWSVSCISHVANNPNLHHLHDPITPSPFSISETALHQLLPGPFTKSVSLDAS